MSRGADDARPSNRSQRGLDWLNFFIADGLTGFGPFVALYLASRHWSQGVIKPALAAIGLGLVGHRALSGRFDRNDRYDSGIGLLGLGFVCRWLPEMRPQEGG